MRHVGHGLHELAEVLTRYLGEQDRENQRDDQLERDLAHGDNQRIAEDLLGVRQQEHIAEPLQSHPLRAEEALCRLEVLKRDDDAEHRQDVKQQENDHPRNQHRVIIFLVFPVSHITYGCRSKPAPLR